MILYVNTTDLNKITLALVPQAGKVIKATHKIPYHESHTTLSHIDKFFKANKIIRSLLSPTPLALSSIIFCSGPGSFTGIRVAASLCQALAFAWSIPLIAIKKEKVPKNLKDLYKVRSAKKLNINYGKPAI